jgi:Tfp pilus assembly protein PilV
VQGVIVSPPGCSRAGGSTLLEVALAMAVMAICALGLMSTQLALARHAQAVAARERAAFAVDAIAEAATLSGADFELRKARVAAIVPDGLASVSNHGSDASIATVTWAFTGYAIASGAVVAPSACNGAPPASGRDCVALAFAR